MILPKKQLSIGESSFVFGGFLLQKLSTPKSAEELWEYYKDSYSEGKYPVKFSFDQYIIALDYLFIIGAIKKMKGGCYAMKLLSLRANHSSFHAINFKDALI